MRIEHKGTKISTCKHVYEPSEDTFLLMDSLRYLNIRPTDNILEIGTGTGIIALHAAKHAKQVTATDINSYALNCAKKNAELNNINNIEIIKSNLFANISKRYNIIIFNPPYLPQEKSETSDDIIDCAWNGGKDGRETTGKFLNLAPLYLKETGQILILDSSKSKYKKTLDTLRKKGFTVKIVKRMNLFFEELVVIKAKKCNYINYKKQKRHL
ncbi:MAG: methyltransferase [Candidatus Nanohalarchaeota archaeon]|nr:MAG: methyltransferase [Candidatus Nanohaloarchaeota archaeon]